MMNSALKLKEMCFISGWATFKGSSCYVSSEGVITEGLSDHSYQVSIAHLNETGLPATVSMERDAMTVAPRIRPWETELTPLIESELFTLINEWSDEMETESSQVVIELESYYGHTLLSALIDLNSKQVLKFKSEPLCHWYSNPLTLEFFEETYRDGDIYFGTDAPLIRLQGIDENDVIYEHPSFDPLFEDENE